VAASPSRPQLLEVGHIGRAHGLRGDVVVGLTTDRLERVAPGARLVTDAGDLEVLASRPHQDRWIVSFAGYDSRDAAERLRGLTLRAEAVVDPDEMWVHDLVGAEVVTTAGDAVGRCTGVVANPASDLLELESGALVPVVFVVDHAPDRVTIDPPEGLFDL
jgi:16S rRNA processing protein RimM